MEQDPGPGRQPAKPQSQSFSPGPGKMSTAVASSAGGIDRFPCI